MSAYLKNIDRGYPGAISRVNEGCHTVKAEVAGAGSQFNYGQPVLLDPAKGTINLYDAAKGSKVFVGFVVRPFPKQGNMTIADIADKSYEGEVHSVMMRGFMTVLVKGTAAVKRGQQVKVATADGADSKKGDIVGASGGTSEELTGAFFNGDAASGEVVEIMFNI